MGPLFVFLTLEPHIDSSIPTLSSPEHIRLWKKGMQHLFRSNGVTQAEVAERMAKIVRRTTGETTSSTTFISALSRFVNAKNSAFPSWFEKTDTRLLPLALAIGLENDQPLWTLLHRSAGQLASEPSIWHPAWPSSRVHVPIMIGGRPLEAVAAEIQQYCNEMSAIHQFPWFFFVGENGSGCRSCVEAINQMLDSPLQVAEFTDIQRAQMLRRQSREMKLVIVRYGRWIPNGLDRSYTIEYWGLRELDILVDKLIPQVEPHTASLLKGYNIACQSNANMLGFDRRAHALIESLAIIAQNDVPESSVELQKLIAGEQWRQACIRAPQLRHFGLSAWSKLCWQLTLEFPEQYMLFCDAVQKQIDIIEMHEGFELHNAAYAIECIERIEQSSKAKRQAALSDLRRWVELSTSARSLDLLIQADLFQRDGQSKTIFISQRILEWACLFPEQIDALPEHIVYHPKAAAIIKALCLNGLLWSRLQSLLQPIRDKHPLWTAKIVLVFWAHQNTAASAQLLPHFALVCAALFQPGLILPYEREFLIEILQSLSEKYAGQLPIIRQSVQHELWSQLPPQVQAQNWRLPSRIQLQALLPYQCPPQNIEEWYQWHPRPPFSISAERVLIWHMHHDDSHSAQLLAEAYDFAGWQQIPIDVRLQALKKTAYSERTPIALCAMVDLLSDNQSRELSIPPRYFDALCEATSAIGWNRIKPLCAEWIAAYIQHSDDRLFGRAKTAILLALNHHDKIVLNDWWAKLWEEMLTVHQTQSEVSQLCVELAVMLWELNHPLPIQQLWQREPVFGPELQKSLLQKSLAAQVLEPIQKWLSSDWEPTELRMALRRSGQLLELAWRHRGTKRSAILLQWAGQLNPTPQWALNEALREAQQHGRWPRWLPPNRPEAAHIVQWMTIGAQGESQFWWASQLHRHQSWPDSLLKALRFWLLEDALPFSVHPWAISKGLSTQNTPPLEPSDKLQLCVQALDTHPEWEWVLVGLRRLWRHHRTEASNKDIFLLGSILLPRGEIDLLREGEELPEAFVRRQLPFVLLRTSSEVLHAVLQESTAHRSFIIPSIHEELLKRHDANSIAFFQRMFERTRDIYWVTGLARYAPTRVYALLVQNPLAPSVLKALLPIILPLLPVGEALRLQSLFGLNMAEEVESEHSKGGAEKT